jgi:hypothetical protein
MAHFAELDENNTVKQVIVVGNENLINENGEEVEELGVNFLEDLFGHRNWKQTSYNNNFRKKYACIGDTYREDKDCFIGEQPFPSWSLNEETMEWDPPVPKPIIAGTFYVWVESELKWKNLVE